MKNRGEGEDLYGICIIYFMKTGNIQMQIVHLWFAKRIKKIQWRKLLKAEIEIVKQQKKKNTFPFTYSHTQEKLTDTELRTYVESASENNKIDLHFLPLYYWKIKMLPVRVKH